MRYDPINIKHRDLLLAHASLDGDDCPVDDLIDSIPNIISYIRSLEESVRVYKSNNQQLSSELADARRKINNIKSQKFRIAKKRGKTLHN